MNHDLSNFYLNFCKVPWVLPYANACIESSPTEKCIEKKKFLHILIIWSYYIFSCLFGTVKGEKIIIRRRNACHAIITILCWVRFHLASIRAAHLTFIFVLDRRNKMPWWMSAKRRIRKGQAQKKRRTLIMKVE